jgi:hypothetical protein
MELPDPYGLSKGVRRVHEPRILVFQSPGGAEHTGYMPGWDGFRVCEMVNGVQLCTVVLS